MLNYEQQLPDDLFKLHESKNNHIHRPGQKLHEIDEKTKPNGHLTIYLFGKIEKEIIVDSERNNHFIILTNVCIQFT